MLICAFCVMLFVEIPLIALFVWPDGIAVGMHRFHDWLGGHAWRIVAVLAFAGAVFAIVKGITVTPE